MAVDPIGRLARELLVRQLRSWAPTALHRSRRATLVQAYAGPDAGTADAALRVFGEFTDLLRGRRLTVVTLAEHPDDLAVRLGGVQAELPAEVSAPLVPGGPDRLPVALTAAGAAGAPILAYVDAGDGPAPNARALAAVAGGRPGELLLLLGAQARRRWDHQAALREAGFPLVTDVELVNVRDLDPAVGGGAASAPAGDADSAAGGGAGSRLAVFATSSGKSLEAFKNAMWAVDEHAGLRYRDPRDPQARLLEISIGPDPEPLRRELLELLDRVGPCTVTELRQYAAAATVYRASDANRVLTALLATSEIIRSPAGDRLAGDVTISLASPAT